MYRVLGVKGSMVLVFLKGSHPANFDADFENYAWLSSRLRVDP